MMYECQNNTKQPRAYLLRLLEKLSKVNTPYP